jgi:Metallo-peptidase family M12
MKKALASFLPLLGLLVAVPAQAAQPSLFTDLNAAEVVQNGERLIAPQAARLVRLDREGFLALAAQAPAELEHPRGLAAIELALPTPDGGVRSYRLLDSPIMAPELAARYPEIRTFRLVDTDHAGMGGRADWTPQGFHAVLRTEKGMFYIDPLTTGDNLSHQVYWRVDLAPRTTEFRCEVDHGDHEAGDEQQTSAAVPAQKEQEVEGSGLDLRTYRTVIAATGEYSTFHGGTVPLAMAAIVTALNRVNEIYERDVAIRMILVANNDLVVYTNGATDPYTNSSGGTMLGQNTTNLNTVIGSANYDIGHVFSTGGGGVATLNGPCGGSKARGVTGLGSPIGDAFYIDYVAHEMGHQWGGNHTFNGSVGSCSGGNRNASTAYEPGSGSTIQAYAGICGSQNLQSNSDAVFHRVSLDEIQNFSRSGNGNTCAGSLFVNNASPTADAGAAYTIPLQTPFILTGSGSDSDGAGTLTYNWEEWDLGPAGAPATPSGNAPIFRSFDSTLGPSRTFPKVQDLVNNTQTIGEILPTYARTLNFRLTVRDNDLPAGANTWDATTVTVDGGSGPFLVTDPNTALTWTGSGPHPVAWNVANTTAAPVNCAAVDIKLSTDGGLTFPTTLATATPNDGNATVNVGVPDTATARIQVMCNGNIFFDISNANFAINGAVMIFADGFETEDTSAWSLTVP